MLPVLAVQTPFALSKRGLLKAVKYRFRQRMQRMFALGLALGLPLLLSAMVVKPASATPTRIGSQAQTQHHNARLSAPGVMHASAAIEAAPTWSKLSPAQQAALKPMRADWAQLDSNRKKKWLAVAQRYQTMSAADQARMHQRMGEWAQLSPAQRSTARDNYSAVLSSPSSSNQNPAAKGNLNEQWAKYQALSPEKKASLIEQSKATDKGRLKPLSAP